MGLTAILNKDKSFTDPLMIAANHRQAFTVYNRNSQKRFQPMYRGLNFEQFREAYNNNYHTYHKDLNPDDMETFDWESEFIYFELDSDELLKDLKK
jgi:hypothetical protein